jgi:hypothetical protein
VKKRFAFLTLPLIALFILIPMACSDTSRTEDSKSVQATDQSGSMVPQKASEGQSEEAGSSIKGGKEVKVDEFTFVIPGDWKEPLDSQIWCPPTEDTTKSLPDLPDHHLRYGAQNSMMITFTGLMAGIRAHIGGEPQDLELMTMGGMEAATCRWESGQYQSIGLFLLEEIKAADMEVLYFFTCRAPKDSFPQYEEIYKAILKSVRL